MYRLEIVSKKGPHAMAWDFFPSLVPTAQSNFYTIHAAISPEPLPMMHRGVLEGWIEEGDIFAWTCEEIAGDVMPVGYITTNKAGEITGKSGSHWRNKAAAGDVAGAYKPGKDWLIPVSVIDAYNNKQEKIMQSQQKKELAGALEAFIASPDFKSGVISSTRASWGGSHYSVELFPDGHSRVLWSNEIGNLYQSDGIILTLPTLDYDPNDKDEYVDGGAGDEDSFLSEQFDCDEQELALELRHSL